MPPPPRTGGPPVTNIRNTSSPFRAGIARAIALGWLWRHESGTYLKFTDIGAALFA
jgi:hypothetical protein